MLLLVFNWYGYRIVLQILGNKANQALQAKLDTHQYKAADLIELRVPLNMPYLSDWKDFETYEGEITIKGSHYQYVKRKICKGELVLLCVANQNRDRLENLGNEFSKRASEFPAPEKKSQKPAKPLDTSSSDYTCTEPGQMAGCLNIPSLVMSSYQFHLPSTVSDPPFQPPNC